MTTAAAEHATAMGAPADLDACPLMPTYPMPTVQFVRGSGTELWDREGRRYLDFLAGLAVVSLGHANAEVADAIADQARTLVHVSNLYGTEPGAAVAQTLDRLLGGGGQVFFCNSGAEANEAALKLARKWGGRGKYQVISAYGSFHGRTLATLHATGPAPEARAVPTVARGFPACGVERPRCARERHRPLGRRGHARAGAGRGRREPGHARSTSPAYASCVTSGVCCSWSTRCRRDSGARAPGSVISTSVSCPMSSPWPRPSATACPSGRAGPGATSRPPSSPAITPRHSAANHSRPRRLARCWRSWSATTHPALARRPGRTAHRSVARHRRCGRGERSGSADRGRTGRRHRRAQVAAAALEAGLVINGVTPTALRLAPPLTVTDAEIDEAMTVLAKVIAEEVGA